MTRMQWRNTIEILKNKLYFIHSFSTNNPTIAYHIDKGDYYNQLNSLGGTPAAHFLAVTEFMSEIGLNDETFEELKNKYDKLPNWLKERIKDIVSKIRDFGFLDADLAAELAELLEDALWKY